MVSGGHASVYFDTAPEAEGRRMVVDKDTQQSLFFFSLEDGTDEISFLDPIVTASPAICAPRISGDMRKGGDLEVDEPMSMTIRYNCATGGSTVITVRIPLDDETLEAVTWCVPPTARRPPQPFQSQPFQSQRVLNRGVGLFCSQVVPEEQRAVRSGQGRHRGRWRLVGRGSALADGLRAGGPAAGLRELAHPDTRRRGGGVPGLLSGFATVASC